MRSAASDTPHVSKPHSSACLQRLLQEDAFGRAHHASVLEDSCSPRVEPRPRRLNASVDHVAVPCSLVVGPDEPEVPDEVEEADDGAVSEREKPLFKQRFQALRRAGSTASLPGRIL